MEIKYLTCKCGNDERKYGGRVSPDGVFTCEICCKGQEQGKTLGGE